MGRTFSSLMFLFLPCIGLSQEVNQYNVSMPIEVKNEVKISSDDPLIKDLRWNRWVTKNFVICSIMDAQGEYLHHNIESMKTWMFTRWGLPDIDFIQIPSPSGQGTESFCRLICVKDQALFKKLFGIDSTKVDIRRTKEGKLDIIVGFLLLDQVPSKVLPMPITEVCLTALSEQRGISFGWWAYRGMGKLNSPVSDVRATIAALYTPFSSNQNVFFSKGLFLTTEAEWEKTSPENRVLFDNESAALCLFLRKEFGQRKLLWFWKDGGQNPEAALVKNYKFASFDQFDASFKRYVIDLSSDVNQVNAQRPPTPDAYLSINNPFTW